MAVTMSVVFSMSCIPISAHEYSVAQREQISGGAASEAMVLLKNENSALPLTSVDKIALFGEGQVYTDGKTGGYLIMGKGSGQFAPTRVPASPSDVFSGYVNDGKLGGVYEPLAASYKAAAAAGGDLLILRRMRNIALRRNMQIRRFLSSVVLLQRVLIIRKRAIR